MMRRFNAEVMVEPSVGSPRGPARTRLKSWYSDPSISIVSSCDCFSAISILATATGMNTFRILLSVFGFFKTSTVDVCEEILGNCWITSLLSSSVRILRFTR